MSTCETQMIDETQRYKKIIEVVGPERGVHLDYDCSTADRTMSKLFSSFFAAKWRSWCAACAQSPLSELQETDPAIALFLVPCH